MAKNLTVNSFVEPDSVKRMWLPVVVAVGLTIATYWTMFVYAVDKWGSSDNHSHGFFVPFASLYLVWHIRKRLAALPRRENPYGLLLIAGALAMHCLGVRSELYRLSMLSFIPLLYGLVLYFMGKYWLRALFFPIGFLIFAFPFPIYIETVTYPLKLFVAKASVFVMDTLGMSVYREGTIVHLPKLSMGVEDACSGLRSLFLVASASAFYAYRFFERLSKRIAFFCLGFPIAIVSNFVRVLLTGFAGYFLGDGQIFRTIHDAAGLVVLVVAGILLVVSDVVLTRVAKYLKQRFPVLQGEEI